MSKYAPLAHALAQVERARVRFSFDQISRMVGGLPASAYAYHAWWANDRGSSHRQSVTGWLAASFEVTRLDLDAQWVEFSRASRTGRAAARQRGRANGRRGGQVEVGAGRQFRFTVVLERDEDGRYVAICPALPGCYSEGETEDEARVRIADAMRLHILERLARGEPINEEVGISAVRVAL